MERRWLMTVYDFVALGQFNGLGNGSHPAGALAEINGNLFGTAQSGGSAGDGTIFEYNASTKQITAIGTFNGANGSSPESGVIADSGGNLFGSTYSGGTGDTTHGPVEGTVFEFDASTHQINDFFTFTATSSNTYLNGKNPDSPLILSGTDYIGTTMNGGSSGENNGELFAFQISPPGFIGQLDFSGLGSDPDGVGSLNQLPYVTINSGVNDGYGAIEIAYVDPDGNGVDTDVQPFNGSDGANPVGGVVFDSNGNAYGVAAGDGINNDGTIFEIPPIDTSSGFYPNPSNPTAIADLTSDTGGDPQEGLTIDSAGDLFGTSVNGGSNSDGTVFELAAGSHQVMPIYTFGGLQDGSNPFGTLLLDSSGNIFGTTENGGNNHDGTLFEISPIGLYLDSYTPSGTTSDTRSLQVHVADTAGQFDASDNGDTATLSIASGPVGAMLTGDTTPATFSGGVATFNYGLSKPGNYTLEVNSPRLGSTTTSTITVTVGPPTQVVVASSSTQVYAGQTYGPIAATIEDAEGNQVTSSNAAVSVAISTGQTGGVLNGLTPVDAAAGVATFSDLSFSKPGTYNLQITSPSLSSASIMNITVLQPFATQLATTAPPTTAHSGQAIAPFSISVEDQAGDVVPSDSSTVALAITSGPAGGAIQGNAQVAAINGVATFSGISFTEPGTYTLQATDGSFTSATISDLVITALPATQLAFVGTPASGSVGQAISSFVVNVEDSSGTVVAGDSSTVNLVIASGPSGGAITSSAQSTAANGVATFSNIAFSLPGTYILTATNGLLSAVTSGAIAIAYPGPQLVFLNAALTAAAGAKLPAIQVQTDSASGTKVTSGKTKISLVLLAGPSGAQALKKTLAVKNGVAILKNLSFRIAGNYVLKASATGYGTGDSEPITISGGALKKLTIVQSPTSAQANSPFSVEAKLTDAFGNVTGDNSIITLALSPQSGAIFAGILSMSPVDGLADFTNLSINQPGTYSIIATDGKAKATTKKFAVS